VHDAVSQLTKETIPMSDCPHLRAVTPAERERPANTPDGCEECLKMGDRWVHLRLCLACGHVGCCDSSKNKHATKHYHRSKHPVIRSFQPGEEWMWCYVDEVMGGEA
jgi:uncharacterized UBP type Zn finger protein